jgi:hypothetical protein
MPDPPAVFSSLHSGSLQSARPTRGILFTSFWFPSIYLFNLAQQPRRTETTGDTPTRALTQGKMQLLKVVLVLAALAFVPSEGAELAAAIQEAIEERGAVRALLRRNPIHYDPLGIGHVRG